jgi:predicted nuclease of predicted toxin-antitoxin system
MAAALEADYFLITMDMGFADLTAFPPGTHPGVLVLRLEDQEPKQQEQAILRLLDAYVFEDFKGCVVVA